jgi:hypothetical protein
MPWPSMTGIGLLPVGKQDDERGFDIRALGAQDAGSLVEALRWEFVSYARAIHASPETKKGLHARLHVTL